MKIETLKERIQNGEIKIEKKINTIEKKKALILKKQDKIRKLGVNPDADKMEVSKVNHEAYWLMCEIEYLKDDIKRGSSEIEEIKVNLGKYKLQLEGEIEKEEVLLKDIPESMKRMQAELVERWDEWDIDRRNRMKSYYKENGWKSYYERYKGSDLHFKDKTDEQIHNVNVRDAKCLILDMYYRVKDITGEITDWTGIHAEAGTHGFTVLNGFVKGKEGRAAVESILAGGYNIQRLHIRVLVKEYK